MRSLASLYATASGVTSNTIGNLTLIRESRQVLADRADLATDLVAAVHDLVADGFDVDFTGKNTASIAQHVLSADGLAFLDDGQTIVGYASYKLYPEVDAFFLYGVTISSKLQGRKAGSLLLDAILDGVSHRWLALTTQNPVIYCWMTNICAHVYPSPDASDIPEHVRVVAEHVMRTAKNLDTDTFVIQDFYETCRYGKLPQSKDASVNSWFDSTLRVENHLTRDAFFFVGDRAGQ